MSGSRGIFELMLAELVEACNPLSGHLRNDRVDVVVTPFDQTRAIPDDRIPRVVIAQVSNAQGIFKMTSSPIDQDPDPGGNGLS